jgi:hypothetical protein
MTGCGPVEGGWWEIHKDVVGFLSSLVAWGTFVFLLLLADT